MEDAEVYEAVKAITQLVNECSIKLDLATSALKDSKEKLTSLLHATMKKTTQSSLDDFSKHETVGSHANNEAFVVKQKTDSYHSTLSEEEIYIIDRMLEDRR